MTNSIFFKGVEIEPPTRLGLKCNLLKVVSPLAFGTYSFCQVFPWISHPGRKKSNPEKDSMATSQEMQEVAEAARGTLKAKFRCREDVWDCLGVL